MGRKKAREILGCARVPEMDNLDVDVGMFHKFLKMDFAQATPLADNDLADTSPSCVLTVYTKCGEKKVVSGRAEVLLASLCGYKNLNGEAVLRSSRRRRGNPNSNTTGGSAHPVAFRPFGNERILGFDEAERFSCPVAAVDKVIPLLEDDRSYSDGANQGGSPLRNAGRGGELRLRALYVPDKVADALGVRAAIKVRRKASWHAEETPPRVHHSCSGKQPLRLGRILLGRWWQYMTRRDQSWGGGIHRSGRDDPWAAVVGVSLFKLTCNPSRRAKIPLNRRSRGLVKPFSPAHSRCDGNISLNVSAGSVKGGGKINAAFH